MLWYCGKLGLNLAPRIGLSRYVRTFSNSRLTYRDKLKWSYLQGESDVPLIGMTIGNVLEDTVSKYPDKEAVIFSECNTRLTFQQLLQQSDQLAAGLTALGVKRGDRVGIWSPNYVEWVLTQYATARAGMIMVNINPAYQVRELEYTLRKVGIKAIICAEKFKTQSFYRILHEICPELTTCHPGDLTSKRLPDLKAIIMKGETNYSGALKFSDVMSAATNTHLSNIKDLQPKLQFDDPINIQFTSGTTGPPKGATLSHHNIVNNCNLLGRRLRFHLQDTRLCVPVPLYHCFGMVMASLQTAVHGTTCVYPSPEFHPKATLQAAEKERCTTLYGTPTMFIDMLNLPDFDHYDLCLDRGIVGGSSSPTELIKNIIEKMNMKHLTLAFGTTENSPLTFLGYLEETLERRISTFGRPFPHVEVKVVNKEGEIVPVGQQGELYTRGHCTMLNYWNDPVKTDEVILPDRWYRTGDIISLDEDGYGRIFGRIKDMIIRGGDNIYPVEIEEFLYTHPKIADVQVIGVPDVRLMEEVCACIRLKDGETMNEDEVKEFCKGQISYFKVPHYIVFVEGYPLTMSGKVQKYKMREEIVKLLHKENLNITNIHYQEKMEWQLHQ